MSTVQEIEAAIPRLTRAEVEALREWIEDYLEGQLELTEEVKSKLDQSRREIAARQFTARRPENGVPVHVAPENVALAGRTVPDWMNASGIFHP